MTLIPQPSPDFEKAYQSINRIGRALDLKNQQILELNATAERYRRALLDILRVRMPLADGSQFMSDTGALDHALEIAREALAE